MNQGTNVAAIFEEQQVGAEEIPAVHHRLLSLSVTGGFLDGLKLDFADGLNCIIGGRGTGKTTALEFIRFLLCADDAQDRGDGKTGISGLLSQVTPEILTACIKKMVPDQEAVFDGRAYEFSARLDLLRRMRSVFHDTGATQDYLNRGQDTSQVWVQACAQIGDMYKEIADKQMQAVREELQMKISRDPALSDSTLRAVYATTIDAPSLNPN